jgi:hypothetical protein
MHPRAGRARYGFISLSLAFSRIVRDPALHVQTRGGASIDEGSHKTLIAIITTDHFDEYQKKTPRHLV